MADGDIIRDYIEDTARKHGIDQHIRFRTTVVSADWDSTTDTWTIHVTENGSPKTYRGRFVFFGSGYYNYDQPYDPDFRVSSRSGAPSCTPSTGPKIWTTPAKGIVVIGSGATAVSLVPALARKAAHVTMLQRSPGYLSPFHVSTRCWNPSGSGCRATSPTGSSAPTHCRWRS